MLRTNSPAARRACPPHLIGNWERFLTIGLFMIPWAGSPDRMDRTEGGPAAPQPSADLEGGPLTPASSPHTAGKSVILLRFREMPPAPTNFNGSNLE